MKAHADSASEVLAKYIDTAHQCPKCHLGPVEHFACGNLTGSGHNKCQGCGFAAKSIKGWPKWDGTLPSSLAVVPGRFTCPFCRAEAWTSREAREAPPLPLRQHL